MQPDAALVSKHVENEDTGFWQTGLHHLSGQADGKWAVLN